MGLSRIRIGNVRNIIEAVVDPGPTLNIVIGNNGSGKSSLLEAVYLLGRAVSFRTNHISEVINSQAKELLVVGTMEGEIDKVERIGVRLSNNKKTVKINGKEVYSGSDLLKSFPLQFISPLSYLLIEGPPNLRRHFMDWGVFHLEPEYSVEWKRFKRCLMQRNTILRTGKTSIGGVWDIEFVKYSTIVARRRKEYIETLLPFINSLGEEMLPSVKIVVDYYPGWDLGEPLENVLVKDSRRDYQFGFTHSGPHKCELGLKIDGKNCKSILSRGQVKLLVLIMKLAQINLLKEKGIKFGSLLIDDFCSELDRDNSKKVKKFLSDMNLQCFISAMDRNSVGTLCGINSTLFHVEQGRIQAI